MNTNQYKVINKNDSVEQKYEKLTSLNLEMMEFIMVKMTNNKNANEHDVEVQMKLKQMLEEIVFKVR
jgi:hypothetical protein